MDRSYVEIKDKNNVVKFKVYDFTITEEIMAKHSLTCELSVPIQYDSNKKEIPYPFETSFYVEYNNDKYYLNSIKPQGKKDNTKINIQYTLVFESLRNTLDGAYVKNYNRVFTDDNGDGFADTAVIDNSITFNVSPSFYGDLYDYVEFIRQNLVYVYGYITDNNGDYVSEEYFKIKSDGSVDIDKTINNTIPKYSIMLNGITGNYLVRVKDTSYSSAGGGNIKTQNIYVPNIFKTFDDTDKGLITPAYSTSKKYNIDLKNTTLLGALKKINENFKYNKVVNGVEKEIGYTFDFVTVTIPSFCCSDKKSHDVYCIVVNPNSEIVKDSSGNEVIFEYGGLKEDGGLLEITRTTNENKVATRVYGMGSGDNLPKNYFHIYEDMSNEQSVDDNAIPLGKFADHNTNNPISIATPDITKSYLFDNPKFSNIYDKYVYIDSEVSDIAKEMYQTNTDGSKTTNGNNVVAVTVLPTTSISSSIIYLIKDTTNNNKVNAYWYNDVVNAWVNLGLWSTAGVTAQPTFPNGFTDTGVRQDVANSDILVLVNGTDNLPNPMAEDKLYCVITKIADTAGNVTYPVVYRRMITNIGWYNSDETTYERVNPFPKYLTVLTKLMPDCFRAYVAGWRYGYSYVEEHTNATNSNKIISFNPKNYTIKNVTVFPTTNIDLKAIYVKNDYFPLAYFYSSKHKTWIFLGVYNDIVKDYFNKGLYDYLIGIKQSYTDTNGTIFYDVNACGKIFRPVTYYEDKSIVEKYGIIESTQDFDSIKPSLTAQYVNGAGRLDEIVYGYVPCKDDIEKIGKYWLDTANIKTLLVNPDGSTYEDLSGKTDEEIIDSAINANPNDITKRILKRWNTIVPDLPIPQIERNFNIYIQNYTWWYIYHNSDSYINLRYVNFNEVQYKYLNLECTSSTPVKFVGKRQKQNTIITKEEILTTFKTRILTDFYVDLNDNNNFQQPPSHSGFASKKLMQLDCVLSQWCRFTSTDGTNEVVEFYPVNNIGISRIPSYLSTKYPKWNRIGQIYFGYWESSLFEYVGVGRRITYTLWSNGNYNGTTPKSITNPDITKKTGWKKYTIIISKGNTSENFTDDDVHNADVTTDNKVYNLEYIQKIEDNKNTQASCNFIIDENTPKTFYFAILRDMKKGHGFIEINELGELYYKFQKKKVFGSDELVSVTDNSNGSWEYLHLDDMEDIKIDFNLSEIFDTTTREFFTWIKDIKFNPMLPAFQGDEAPAFVFTTGDLAGEDNKFVISTAHCDGVIENTTKQIQTDKAEDDTTQITATSKYMVALKFVENDVADNKSFFKSLPYINLLPKEKDLFIIENCFYPHNPYVYSAEEKLGKKLREALDQNTRYTYAITFDNLTRIKKGIDFNQLKVGNRIKIKNNSLVTTDSRRTDIVTITVDSYEFTIKSMTIKKANNSLYDVYNVVLSNEVRNENTTINRGGTTTGLEPYISDLNNRFADLDKGLSRTDNRITKTNDNIFKGNIALNKQIGNVPSDKSLTDITITLDKDLTTANNNITENKKVLDNSIIKLDSNIKDVNTLKINAIDLVPTKNLFDKNNMVKNIDEYSAVTSQIEVKPKTSYVITNDKADSVIVHFYNEKGDEIISNEYKNTECFFTPENCTSLSFDLFDAKTQKEYDINNVQLEQSDKATVVEPYMLSAQKNEQDLSSRYITKAVLKTMDSDENFAVPNIQWVKEQLKTTFDSKVDKVRGKDLSTNDFSNDYKDKIDKLSSIDFSKINQQLEVNIVSTEFSKTINHNLGRYPSVYFIDTQGIKYECDIQHIDKNRLVASWNTAINGKLIIG